MAKGQFPMPGGIVELQGQKPEGLGCGHHPTDHNTHSARRGQNYDLTDQRELSPGRLLSGFATGAPITTLADDSGHAVQEAASEPRTDHHKHSKPIQQNRGHDERQRVTGGCPEGVRGGGVECRLQSPGRFLQEA